MEERSEALKLLGDIKDLCQSNNCSVEVAMRAIAMQAVIFERINPQLWSVAVEDALEGISLALPESEQ